MIFLGVNRTVINQKAFDETDPSMGPDLEPGMNKGMSTQLYVHIS
jgi:hypothetical protein